MKKIILNTITVINCLFFAWFILSYFNVIAHNLEPNPQYWSWNLFEILFH